MLSGGWVSGTSRSSTIGSQLLDRECLPWLANPGNSAMSPHAGEGKRHPSQWKNSGKREGRGGKLPGWWAVTPNNAANTHLKHMQECLQWRAHGIQMHAHMQKTRERWMLFVVNSLKLHLKKRMQCMQFNVKSAILPISLPYDSLKLEELGEFGVISSVIL